MLTFSFMYFTTCCGKISYHHCNKNIAIAIKMLAQNYAFPYDRDDGLWVLSAVCDGHTLLITQDRQRMDWCWQPVLIWPLNWTCST